MADFGHPVYNLFDLLAPKDWNYLAFQYFDSGRTVPDEDYSRNASCTLKKDI